MFIAGYICFPDLSRVSFCLFIVLYKVNTIFYIFENISDLYLGRMYSEFASKLRIGIMFNMSFCIFFYIICFVFGFDFSDLFLFSFNILVLLFFIIVGLVWSPLL